MWLPLCFYCQSHWKVLCVGPDSIVQRVTSIVIEEMWYFLVPGGNLKQPALLLIYHGIVLLYFNWYHSRTHLPS